MTEAQPAHAAWAQRGQDIRRLMAMTDLATAFAIRVAATLRLADLAASGAENVDRLAVRTDVDPAALERLLRHLVACGMFAEPEPRTFELTDFGRLLADDHPFGMRAWLDLDGGMGRSDLAFGGLLNSVRTGQTAFPEIFGRAFWDDLMADPERAASFDRLMVAQASGTAAEIAENADWEGVGHVVDVGGGHGVLLTTILLRNPRTRGTLVELPTAAEGAQRHIAEAGVADRCTVAPGSFFDELPANADVYVLSHVLHDWSDRDAVAILRRCSAAAGRKGRVLVAEHLLEDNHAPPSALVTSMDLRMLTTFGGKERRQEDFRALLEEAGINIRQVVRTPTGWSILECSVADPGS